MRENIHYLFSFDQILLSGITNRVSKVQTKKKKDCLDVSFFTIFSEKAELISDESGWLATPYSQLL